MFPSSRRERMLCSGNQAGVGIECEGHGKAGPMTLKKIRKLKEK
jgi:hypothetical protein